MYIRVPCPALARKSTSIVSKPFLAMFIDCACASFRRRITERLSSRALIDMYHCCCFDQSRVDSRCTLARQERAFRITGRSSGTRIRGNASGTAINSLCIQYVTERGYHSTLFCKSLELWLLSPLVLSPVVWNSQTFLSCRLWTPIYRFQTCRTPTGEWRSENPGLRLTVVPSFSFDIHLVCTSPNQCVSAVLFHRFG